MYGERDAQVLIVNSIQGSNNMSVLMPNIDMLATLELHLTMDFVVVVVAVVPRIQSEVIDNSSEIENQFSSELTAIIAETTHRTKI